MKSIPLGHLAGLKISATPSVFVATPILWGILSGLAIWAFDIAFWPAVVGGLVGAGLHWFNEIWHQLGHAMAARRTGYPMYGLRLWLLLGASLYPRDEPDLPPVIHIRRALGGPIFSAILAVAGGLALVLLEPADGVVRLTAWFLFFEAAFIFTLGAFIPLGFNDGSTLLYWVPRWFRERQT